MNSAKNALDKLEHLYRDHIALLAPDFTDVRLVTRSTGMGGAHIEYDQGGYHYIVNERGTEYERRTTKDTNEVLSWLVVDAVINIADRIATSDYKSRGEFGENYRISRILKEIELLSLSSLSTYPHPTRYINHLKTLIEK